MYDFLGGYYNRSIDGLRSININVHILRRISSLVRKLFTKVEGLEHMFMNN